MRAIYLLLLLAFIGVGSWWVYQNSDTVSGFVQNYTEKPNNQFLALQPLFTADQVVDTHRSELPSHKSDTKLAPALKFYPYLLLDVAYNQSGSKKREGVILWSMDNGEMVLDTSTWNVSKGFGPMLSANADENDYRVIKTIAARGSSISREQLRRLLAVDSDVLDQWTESARRKGLIVQDGNVIRLRIPDANLAMPPFTNISQRLVTKSYSDVQKQPTKFSKDQIAQAAQAAFGPDIAIHEVKEVFVPVYSISMANPDGSVETTYWNALNGRRYSLKDSVTSSR